MITPEQNQQMKKDMVVVFKHFHLPADVVKVARESAERSKNAAARCYRAIARSLE